MCLVFNVAAAANADDTFMSCVLMLQHMIVVMATLTKVKRVC